MAAIPAIVGAVFIGSLSLATVILMYFTFVVSARQDLDRVDRDAEAASDSSGSVASS